MMTANHTHSGPGSYSFYTLYNVGTRGFDIDNYNKIINGITQSIIDAYNNMVDNVSI